MFSNYKASAFTSEFRKYITTTIKYRFINPRWMYSISYDKVYKNFIQKPLPASYYEFLRKLNINDHEAVGNTCYDIALDRYVSEMIDAKLRKEIPENIPEQQRIAIFDKKKFSIIKNSFSSNVLDYQLTCFVKQLLNNPNTDKGLLDEVLTDYKKIVRNQTFRTVIEKLQATKERLAAGKAAPDFTLINDQGKIVSLSSLKGKTVYIDFWATWCVPCLVSMPKAKQLAEKLKARNDIVFLYLNVNDSQDKWKQYLLKEKPEGLHLYADKEQSALLYTQFNIVGIPHYVIIDKAGNLVTAQAEGPAGAEKQLLDAAR